MLQPITFGYKTLQTRIHAGCQMSLFCMSYCREAIRSLQNTLFMMSVLQASADRSLESIGLHVVRSPRAQLNPGFNQA